MAIAIPAEELPGNRRWPLKPLLKAALVATT
jgi:hypothetical protein